MVLFELMGSSFALLQLIMDLMAANQKKEEGFDPTFAAPKTDKVNTIKLFMAMFSIAFDFVFLIQHYIMYKESVI